MFDNNKNTILAIVLSALVLIAWQYFVGLPQMEKQKQEAQLKAQQEQVQKPAQSQPQQPGQPTPAGPGDQPGAVPGQSATVPGQTQTREAVIASSPRIKVETPRLAGTIALKGGRIDDLALTQYRETIDPKSPPIVLLEPSGAPHPFYAEFGWVGAAGSNANLPGPDTVWTRQGSGPLTVDKPVTLTYDNGEGLEFRRTISVDDKYLFTIQDEVANKGNAPVSLYPYGLVSRHGTPEISGYAIRHEGPIGVMGDKCLRQSGFALYTECHEESYKTIEEKKSITFDVTNAWFGFTDAYWAAALIPDTKAHITAHYSSALIGNLRTYQADFFGDQQNIPAGAEASSQTRLFAGAREVAVVDSYDEKLGLNHFDLLIDWGRLYLITKPMFWSIDWIYHFVGNFGIAILLITVIVKLIFFPLANKSYASMAKMKAVQPEMTAIRARYADDKVKQQTALMELYKKERINPVAGCLPMIIQIPVFYSLYKVLFVSIEMRHAPFFGWIHDLSAPDPTNVFNLFGLLAFDPTVVPVVGHFLHLGIWPLIMGVTMFLQMKLNPTPPDPTQKMMFDWMPVIFTFMLASFSAGLVIYWAWNNTLSVAQQSVIMHRNGAKIELWDNLKALFVGKKKDKGKK